MQLLYDKSGTYIAYTDSGRLYSLLGANIGHYLSNEGVFVDQTGRYLGEVIQGNRFMCRVRSPHRDSHFAVSGTFASGGRFGNPGRVEAAENVAGFKDVAAEKLA